MNIQHFQFNLSYLRGQSNVLADALYRFPVPCADSSITDAENPEYTLCFLLKSSPVDMKAVALATAADPSLSVVVEHISSSWSLAGASQVRPYFTFRDELTAKACRQSDGKSMVVLHGDRVVIPAALQAQIIAQAHEAHAGEQKNEKYHSSLRLMVGLFARHRRICKTAKLVLFSRRRPIGHR